MGSGCFVCDIAAVADRLDDREGGREEEGVGLSVSVSHTAAAAAAAHTTRRAYRDEKPVDCVLCHRQWPPRRRHRRHRRPSQLD